MSWTLLESQILSGSQASITLGSGGTLNQGYKTLKVVVSARTLGGTVGDIVTITFNGSSTSFTTRLLYGTGSAAASANYTTGYFGNVDGNTATASTFGSAELTIPNYAGSTNKPYSIDGVHENNAAAAQQEMWAGLWSNTAAITSIALAGTGNFVTGSSFYLYGLK